MLRLPRGPCRVSPSPSQACSVLTRWPESLSESVVPPLPKDAREPWSGWSGWSRCSVLSSRDPASSKSLLDLWLYLELRAVFCCGADREGREAPTLEVPKYVSWMRLRIFLTHTCFVSRLFALRITCKTDISSCNNNAVSNCC